MSPQILSPIPFLTFITSCGVIPDQVATSSNVKYTLPLCHEAISPIETIKKEPIESEEIIEYDFANKDDESVSLQVKIKTTWPLVGKMVTQN